MTQPEQNASRAARELANSRPVRSVVCQSCGEAFTARDKRAKYCSNRCRQAAKYKRSKGGDHTPAS